MARRREVPANLRPRAGLNPTRVRMEPSAECDTALAFLQSRFPADTERIAELVADGEVFDAVGDPINAATAFQPNQDLYLFRDPPANEPAVPALSEIEILHRDDDLLVVDKPHQVSVIPRGRWVTQTALVYLRNLLDLPDLSPLHRLDRPTAGVLVFAIRPEVRGPYQMMFQNRQVRKEYQAVTKAPAADSELAQSTSFPLVVRSRIEKHRGIAPAQEVPGEVNAETEVNLQQINGDRALWRLVPKTGKTHQLRLHMFSLGYPIIGDPFWPYLQPDLAGDPDPDPPLQLLAKVIEFIDPLSGEQRRFESQRGLSFWE